MTDYPKTNNNRRATQMRQTFTAWERGLRGWQTWDYAVNLEPAFSRIRSFSPVIIAPVDDAKIKSRFGQWFGKNQTDRPRISVSHTALLPPQTGETAKQPPAFYRREVLTELGLVLPKDSDFSPAVCEQFFLSLGSFSAPLAFEILADANSISIQFACDSSLTAHLKTQVKNFFPNCLTVEKQAVLKSHFLSQEQTVIVDFGLARNFLLPLQTFRNFNPDPLTGLIGSLGNLQPGEKAVVQILFQKAKQNWTEEVQRIFADAEFKTAFTDQIPLSGEKFSSPLFAVSIRLAAESANQTQSWNLLRRIGGGFSTFSTPNGNELIALSNDALSPNNHFLSLLNRTSYRSGMLLNTAELASFAHLPSSAVNVQKLKRDNTNTKAAPHSTLNHSLILGINEHHGINRQITLSNDQRTKHLHLIGSSGSGKSTLLLNLIKQDLENNQGLCVIDPHGDLIDEVISNVPNGRLKDVIMFDPSDSEFPIGFNILQANSELEKTLLASDLVATFRRMATTWGNVMDSVLANAILAFIESSRGGTLFDLRRFLVEKDFRADFLQTVADESVRYFWEQEFPHLTGKPQSSILIRLDSFLRNKMMRNIVCQKQTKLDFRKIMDEKKVLLIKLSQGLIGEENSHLLGTLLVSKIYQTALSRQDSNNRPYYWLFLDEFQHFVTPSMESILSGVRKYNIGLHLAHQEFRQLQSRSQEVASSVLSNCYTRICFRLGDTDAEKFASGFSFFDSQALQNLGIGEAIERCERAEFDFNLKTSRLPKINPETAHRRKQIILQNTRENFSKPRVEVEAELMSGRAITQVTQKTIESKTEWQKAKVEKVDHVAEKPPEQVEPVKAETDNSHRYLQSIIKRIGESHGFVATLEKQVFGGIGKVDVALENESFKIAVEVAITNTVEYELQNIQKCLAAGFDKVVVIASDSKHLANIKRKAEDFIAEKQFSKVNFLEPENFHLFLEKLNTESKSPHRETKVKGYKIKVSFKETSQSEQQAKEQTITEILQLARGRKK